MKIFGILAVVLGIWVAMEVFNKGVDHAFGGIFASEEIAAGNGNGNGNGQPRSVSRRSGDSVEDAHTDAARRRERLLGE